MEGFYDGVVDSWYYEGKLVGLPGLLNTYGIFTIKIIPGCRPPGTENRLDLR